MDRAFLSSLQYDLDRGVDPAALGDMGYPVTSNGDYVPVDKFQSTQARALLEKPAPATNSNAWEIDPHTRELGLRAIRTIREQLQNRQAS